MTAGPLCLVGGAEWTDGCDFDATLLQESGAGTVVVLATAAAYEGAGVAVDQARAWFTGLGVEVAAPNVITRPDAFDAANVAAVRGAGFIYLAGGPTGGSPMHLRSVLKDSPLFDGMVEAWRGGAVLAGAGAGGGVLFDHMVDTRGGAFTVGLGLLSGFTMIQRYDTWSSEKVHRTVDLAAAGMPVAGIEERTALVHRAGSGWTIEGAGTVHVFRNGTQADLGALPTPV
ncbi:MAG: Type 1 glutamine amidotransferase-like domain-containing protein [Acidimicrobiia bacterium]|nr:Type 1 glutamine amidotransferase-like domain-containing protein [Acidimicrobiia bacterium]